MAWMALDHGAKVVEWIKDIVVRATPAKVAKLVV